MVTISVPKDGNWQSAVPRDIWVKPMPVTGKPGIATVVVNQGHHIPLQTGMAGKGHPVRGVTRIDNVGPLPVDVTYEQ